MPGGRRCVTCSHPALAEINSRLQGPDREPLNVIAVQYGLSNDALERHVERHVDILPRPPAKSDRNLRWMTPRELSKTGARAKPPEPAPAHAAAAVGPGPPPPEPPAEPKPPDKPLTPQQAKARFLEILAEYGSPAKAARAAGVTRQKIFRWQEEDEVFGFAYNQSLVAATEGLEEVARERATRGARIERQVWRSGRLIETIIEYRPSDTALITLLKAQKPDVYRERIDQSVSGEVSVRYTNDWRSVGAPQGASAPQGAPAPQADPAPA